MPSYDLHSHTNASDGQLTPTALVQRAVQQRVNVLAITDHDSTLSWQEALMAIQQQQLPLKLVPGVEITCQWQQQEIHVVGLQFAIDDKPLQLLLAQQRHQRHQRAHLMADYLAQRHGILGIREILQQRYSVSTALTRLHLAQLLVQQRYGRSIAQVFQRYLANPVIMAGDIAWCYLSQAIQQIQAAGGQAVLAHPERYPLTETQWIQLLTDFQQAGGDGIEIAYSRQTNSQRLRLAEYAQRFQLLASVGSDFHYHSTHNELGKGLQLPAGCQPIWGSWKI